MRRTTFCEVAGITLDRLKNLDRRGLWPFALPEKDGKWARMEYSGRRAVLLELMNQLSDSGMQFEHAARALRDRESYIFDRGPIIYTEVETGVTETRSGGSRALLPTQDPSNDVWLGITLTGSNASSLPFIGTLSNIAIDINDAQLIDQRSAGAIFLVNISEAIRTVRLRAAACKTEPHEFEFDSIIQPQGGAARS